MILRSLLNAVDTFFFHRLLTAPVHKSSSIVYMYIGQW